MLAGAAEVDITPPVGVDLTGYVARLGPSVGVHDLLYARALVMDDGSRRAALVVCDLLGLDRALAAQVRQEIAGAIGARPEAVMVACTHTHAGPATFFLHQCGEVNQEYLAVLPTRLRRVAVAAAAELQPVCVAVGEGALPEGALNRRGSGLEPDTAVGVALLEGAEGTALATVLSYGCHPVTMQSDNRLISADYPGVATRAVAEAQGGTALFMTGAGGDVNPARRSTFEAVDWLGQALAGEAVRVARGLTPEPAGSLGVALETLALPLQAPPSVLVLDGLLRDYRRELAAARNGGDPVRLRVAQAMVGWAEHLAARMAAGTVPRSIEVEIQAIAVGPWVVVGVPGELFSGLGARIKTAVRGHPVFVVGYANGDVGYIADREAYETGGYEVAEAHRYYDAPAAFAPEAGEMVVAAGRRLVRAVAQVRR